MDYQKCPKRFYFAQILKLKPKEYPPAMERGITGHRFFEAFFKCMMEGGDYDDCVAAINPLLEDPEVYAKGGMEIYRHVLAYGAYYFSRPWKPIEVETNHIYEVEDGLEFAFTPDLLSEWLSGPKRGSVFAIDFKFTGQYWNEGEVAMAQQLPKYIRYHNLKHAGRIHSAYLVELNTRAAKGAVGTKLFIQQPVKITTPKLNRIQYENEELMREIADKKENHRESGDYVRTVDTFQCKRCFFAGDLCPADLEGRDTHRIIEREYEVNTYFEDNYGVEDG